MNERISFVRNVRKAASRGPTDDFAPAQGKRLVHANADASVAVTDNRLSFLNG